MRDPERQSTEAPPHQLSDAERIQLAVRCAMASAEAVRRRLLFDLSGFEVGEPPLIDGEPASLGGEPIDLVRWLVERVAGTCEDGAFADLDLELRADGIGDPLERMTEDVRDERRIERHRRSPAGGEPEQSD